MSQGFEFSAVIIMHLITLCHGFFYFLHRCFHCNRRSRCCCRFGLFVWLLFLGGERPRKQPAVTFKSVKLIKNTKNGNIFICRSSVIQVILSEAVQTSLATRSLVGFFREVKGQMLLETKPVRLPSFNLLWISLRTFSIFYFPQETHLEVN